MDSEVKIIKDRLLPMSHFFLKRLGAEWVKATVDDLATDSLRQFVSSDETATFLFENLTCSESVTIGGFDTLTSGRLKVYYSDFDCSEHMIPMGFFVFGHGGDGSAFALNLKDRKIYNIDTGWNPDDGGNEVLSKTWESFDTFCDYLEEQAQINFPDYSV